MALIIDDQGKRVTGKLQFVKNNSATPFNFQFNSECYTIEAGQTEQVPEFLVTHISRADPHKQIQILREDEGSVEYLQSMAETAKRKKAVALEAAKVADAEVKKLEQEAADATAAAQKLLATKGGKDAAKPDQIKGTSKE